MTGLRQPRTEHWLACLDWWFARCTKVHLYSYLLREGYLYTIDKESFCFYFVDATLLFSHLNLYEVFLIRSCAYVALFFSSVTFDLFELMDGYKSGYGLYYVDASDKSRYPKLSSHWYANFLKGKNISKIKSFQAWRQKTLYLLHIRFCLILCCYGHFHTQTVCITDSVYQVVRN